MVREIVRICFPGGFPAYVDREDIEQECLIRIPEIVENYEGRGGAKVDTFVRGAIRNDVRDYLRRKHRENGHVESVALPQESGIFAKDGRRISGDGPSEEFRRKHEGALGWLLTSPDGSITEDDMETVKGVLTPDQYRVYFCRFVLGMTQQETADYLRTTREAVASRQRKLTANLKRASLPVPKSVA